MPGKKIILILFIILVLVCKNREKKKKALAKVVWCNTKGAATVISPWVIADAGQRMGHTQYHLMIIISVLLVIQQIYAVEVKKKKYSY